MSNPWFFSTLRPAFVGESFYDTVTIDGSGSIAAWTLVATLLDSDGVFVLTPTVTILDPTARTVQVAILNVTLAAADYTLNLTRTDTAFQTVVAWATLEVVNAAGANAWGQGFAT